MKQLINVILRIEEFEKYLRMFTYRSRLYGNESSFAHVSLCWVKSTYHLSLMCGWANEVNKSSLAYMSMWWVRSTKRVIFRACVAVLVKSTIISCSCIAVLGEVNKLSLPMCCCAKWGQQIIYRSCVAVPMKSTIISRLCVAVPVRSTSHLCSCVAIIH